MDISKIKAREILDSRGNPTLEVDIYSGGSTGRFSVPSGASTGKYEALEKRDGDKSRFDGKGVKELAEKMNEIFLEVVMAADFEPEALEVFEKKKRLKLFAQGGKKLVMSKDTHDFKHVDGGFVYQNSDCICDNEVHNAHKKSELTASEQEMKDLEIAWKVAGLTKSNCVVYVKDSAMVAVGMGMTSRVDAAQCALKKAKEMGIDVQVPLWHLKHFSRSETVSMRLPKLVLKLL